MGIKDIAKLANVSIGTVDRVLNKRVGVSKETEKRILKIIKETGYVKNTTASRLKLASVKKIKIAVLVPESLNKWSYWKLPKKGIAKAVEELRELGVTAVYNEFSNSSSFIKKGEEILCKKYDALITVPYFEKECNRLLKHAGAKKIPVVFLDTEIKLNGMANFIRQDAHTAGLVAGRLLHGLVGNDGQYFLINLLNERGTQVNNKQREDGFREFFRSIKVNANIKIINHHLNDVFRVTREIKDWFDGDHLKGIFVTNSRAHLIPNILKQHEITNTHIIGFDLNKQNLLYLKRGEIDFLINQQPEYQGYAAIKSLFNYLTKEDESELNLNIPVEIIVKENLPAGDSSPGLKLS